MTYTVPPGYKVGIQFKASHVIPSGYCIGLEFAPSEAPPGSSQVLSATGWRSLEVGNPSARLKQLFIRPAGWSASAWTQPTIYNLRRYVPAGGLPSRLAFGAHTIFNRDKYVTPAGWLAQSFGTQFAAYFLRNLGSSGWDSARIGSQSVKNRNLRVNPGGWDSFSIYRPTLDQTHFVKLAGWDSQAFGTRIIPEVMRIDPKGLVYTEWGTPLAWNWRQKVLPAGFTTVQQDWMRWGQQTVWNLKQVIAQLNPSDGDNVGEKWGRYTGIENGNKTVEAYGEAFLRFGYQQIDNKARPIKPGGIAPPEDPWWIKRHTVTHGIQQLAPVGFDSLVQTRWHFALNKARLVAATGWSAQAFAIAALANRNRSIRHISGPDQHTGWGTAFIADRVRGIAITNPSQAITAPPFPNPSIRNDKGYITPTGWDSFSFKPAYVFIRWNIVAPRWTKQHDDFGWHAARNVTPEVKLFGHDSTAWGVPSVRTQWRESVTRGDDMQRFGKTTIADNRLWVYPSAILSLKLGQHTVTRLGEDPPQTRILRPYWANEIGVGVGTPSLGEKALHPSSWDSLAIGQTKVTANSIRVEPGIGIEFMGTPEVSLRNRKIYPEGWHEDVKPSRVGLSPLTIWAVVEAPLQARNNHLPPTLHYVNSDGGKRNPGEVFGSATISNKHRRIFPVGVDFGWQLVSRPDIRNKLQRVFASGWNNARVGWPMFWGVPQNVDVVASADTANVGSPSVTRPPYTGPQTLRAAAYSATQWGVARVEHFHRKVDPSGWAALAMGASVPGEYLYLPQSLNIGPRRPVLPKGSEMTAWGLPWISFLRRDLKAQPWDSSILTYDRENFQRRMRVITTQAPPPERQVLRPVGWSQLATATPNVKPKNQHITPWGDMDNWRKNHANVDV